MRLSGYLCGPTSLIFEALGHIMRYSYFYRHIPLIYPAKPISRKSLSTHWAHGTAEYLSPEYGTQLVNTIDADHTRDIRDRRSTTSTISLLNGVTTAWKCNNQSTTTLNSTGSKIISLATGVKGSFAQREFISSLGYPIGEPTNTLEDNQGKIKCIVKSRIHETTNHLFTRISWLHEMFLPVIVKPSYTKTKLQLSDVNTKPLCSVEYHTKLAFLFGLRFYPNSNTHHYQTLYLHGCRLYQ
jgi:hypothetical protein